MRRHELREQVFKLLFRIEFNTPEDMPEQLNLYCNGFGAEEEGAPLKVVDMEKASDRFELIQGKIADIDALINENTEGWDTNRMGKVELTVLRLAVFEMLYDEDVPTNVAINEAVEIAKKYGQEGSGAFVNAILGKIAKSGD